MAAITVKPALYPAPLGNHTHLRISVDRDLTLVGGPVAGVVATVPVTGDNAYVAVPAVNLFSIRGTNDAVTRGAMYKAEWVDGTSGLVTPVIGLETFRIDIPCPETTWAAIQDYTDAYLRSLSELSNGQHFGLTAQPNIIRSVVTVLGADVSHEDQTIILVFGRGPNAPMLCADASGIMISMGGSIVTISAKQPERVVSASVVTNVVAATDSNIFADTTNNDVPLRLPIPGPTERNVFEFYNIGTTGFSVQLIPPAGQSINGLAVDAPFIFSGSEQRARAVYCASLSKYFVAVN